MILPAKYSLLIAGACLVVSADASVLALYDAQTGINGDFNTTAFDSVDNELSTTATRLAQGGSLNGGGANSFVLDRDFFDTSDSGSPGFNLAGGDQADQSAASTAGDYYWFDLQPNENSVTYEEISFFNNQFASAGNGRLDISYQIGAASEVFVLQNHQPAPDNVDVVQTVVDFGDFTTDQTVSWTFYLYGADASNEGTRFDDISLSGTVIPEPSAFSLLAALFGGLFAFARRPGRK